MFFWHEIHAMLLFQQTNYSLMFEISFSRQLSNKISISMVQLSWEIQINRDLFLFNKND